MKPVVEPKLAPLQFEAEADYDGPPCAEAVDQLAAQIRGEAAEEQSPAELAAATVLNAAGVVEEFHAPRLLASAASK